MQSLQELLSDVDGGRVDAPKAWKTICRNHLTPDQPFEEHQELFKRVYRGWDRSARGPCPAWIPCEADVSSSNIARFMSTFQDGGLWDLHKTGDPAADLALLQQVSCSNPEAFWRAALKELAIRFHTPPDRMLRDDPNPDRVRWLPGARLNIAQCALCCPRAPPDAPAIVWAAEGQPEVLQRVSRPELQHRCACAAASLRTLCQPGDAVAIDMPMTVESVVIYLATVLAGCAVVSIADSFAPHEIATRLTISQAKLIFTQDVVLRGGKALPLYARVKQAAGSCRAVVLPADGGAGGGQLREPLRPEDLCWEQFLSRAAISATTGSGAANATADAGTAVEDVALQAHIADAYDTTNILFSSGTTGEPKAITWSHVTPLRPALNAWAQQDVHPGDVVTFPTSMGWMMGPWVTYASLLNGATLALYQGAPLGRDFGQFVAAARVRVLGLVPSIVKAWRHSGCMAGLDWGCLRCFHSTGEASAPEDYHWLMARVRGYRPVVEYIGGTEVGGAFLTASLLQPQAPSTFSTPALGANLALMDAGGNVSPHSSGEPFTGELVLVPPFLGGSQQLLNRDHYAAYYAGMPLDAATGKPLRRHGDEMQRMRGGYYCALGRVDDTMNLGGIKVSSVELERAVVEGVADVAEAAAVAMLSPGGGPELLHLFLVLKPSARGAAVAAGGSSSHSSSGDGGDGGVDGSGSARSKGPGVTDAGDLKQQCQVAIRQLLNPLFKVEHVWLRDSLPRNAANKIMRRVLRDQFMQRPKL